MQVTSQVEKIALEHSGFRLQYDPFEKIGVIVVDNFPVLGKLTAWRFLEWVQQNPEGVVALPTGKTPEFFIKEVQRLLGDWDQRNVQKELDEGGLDYRQKPVMKQLRFVQIDDFYPIDPRQHNSFYHYVNKYYIDGLGLDRGKAMLIDCTKIGLPRGKKLADIWPDQGVDITLRYRQPVDAQQALQKQVLENVDQWCLEYEQRIREMGGIGFFLGGIGPDGHIGFNISGSDLNSTTRLTPTNYKTQAAAAADLGGIEVSKKRLVITIGLSTITYNPDCVAIIIAAGEAKAKIVADAIQKPEHIRYPASALHKLPAARFYLTRGAAKLLRERNFIVIQREEKLPDPQIEKIIIDLSLEKKKRIAQLTKEDFKSNHIASALLKKRPQPVAKLTELTRQSLVKKIEAGTTIQNNKIFLHTEPHHDDVMLGYLPYVVRHIREHSNQHHFATLTSGFTAVTNAFMLDLLRNLKVYLKRGFFEQLYNQGYFDPKNLIGKNRDVWQYLDGVAANSETQKLEGKLRRLLRNLIDLYETDDMERVQLKLVELIHYFRKQYPGKKDSEAVQELKGMCREWEADCLWGYFGWHSESVHHLRLGFYQGDIFTEEPTVERDVLPVLELIRKIQPDVVSVALDPEASGPDTHYKALQAMTEALRIYEKESGRSDLEIIGYRNVWYRFHPCEVDICVPVSLNMFALQDNAFKNSFVSQKDASFPSYEYDGPFSDLAQKIQVEQYQMLKTCLGREFFNEHPSALIRATRGMVFLERMDLSEFYQRSRELKESTENL